MESEPNNVNAGANNEPVGTTGNEPKTKTFDEILTNKKYQAEFDRRVQKSIQTAQANWKVKQDKNKTQEERLAKMNEIEKLQYKLEQQEKVNQEIQKRLNARDLKDEAIKIATTEKTAFEPEFINLFDYENMTVEQLQSKTKLVKIIQDRIIKRAINEFSRKPSPKNVDSENDDTEEYIVIEILKKAKKDYKD